MDYKQFLAQSRRITMKELFDIIAVSSLFWVIVPFTLILLRITPFRDWVMSERSNWLFGKKTARKDDWA